MLVQQHVLSQIKLNYCERAGLKDCLLLLGVQMRLYKKLQ